MFVVLLAGCAGRTPHLVPVYSPGDEKQSCQTLKREIVEYQLKMLALLPKTDKTLINTLWSASSTVAGATPAGPAVGVVPYLFIDMKDADRIEYEAYRRRHNRLLLIARAKVCDLNDITAEPIPSLSERKVIEEQAKKSADVNEKSKD
jgi:hypothetical protein